MPDSATEDLELKVFEMGFNDSEMCNMENCEVVDGLISRSDGGGTNGGAGGGGGGGGTGGSFQFPFGPMASQLNSAT